VEVAAFRIVQEGLANVVRHSRAHACSIRVFLADGALNAEIEDDGIGLEASAAHGVGLDSMGERAAEVGGQCTIEARAAGGTLVSARLPLREA
jgi:signal transduction histidine kinase